MKPVFAFGASVLSLIVGIALIMVPHIGAEPSVSCVPEGQPTSGYALNRDDGSQCPLSVDDFHKYYEWAEKSALPLHRVGGVLLLLAIVLLIVGIVLVVRRQLRRRRKLAQPRDLAQPVAEQPRRSDGQIDAAHSLGEPVDPRRPRS